MPPRGSFPLSTPLEYEAVYSSARAGLTSDISVYSRLKYAILFFYEIDMDSLHNLKHPHVSSERFEICIV